MCERVFTIVGRQAAYAVVVLVAGMCCLGCKHAAVSSNKSLMLSDREPPGEQQDWRTTRAQPVPMVEEPFIPVMPGVNVPALMLEDIQRADTRPEGQQKKPTPLPEEPSAKE